MNVELHYTDPETGERETLDLTGWRFRVTLGDMTIELELDGSTPPFGPRDFAPIAVAYVDGTPCVVAYTRTRTWTDEANKRGG